ncbi:MAG: S4 domain-containing protein YaaA [Faecalicoccus sp.]|nr:S4 domain-containing protein YaaA [Faecalicoccus sp.]
MEFSLHGEYITLQQLLKACDVVSSGGEAKIFLEETDIYVNGEPENRRGKKIRKGDIVSFNEIRIEVK